MGKFKDITPKDQIEGQMEGRRRNNCCTINGKDLETIVSGTPSAGYSEQCALGPGQCDTLTILR
jgi:hypothetical protein